MVWLSAEPREGAGGRPKAPHALAEVPTVIRVTLWVAQHRRFSRRSPSSVASSVQHGREAFFAL